MDQAEMSVDQFRKAAREKFGFLEALGFRHAPQLEETSSTFGTVVYLGEHVGIIFSLDLRDQCVDGEVSRVRRGKLQRNWEGGYSSNIFSHLVKYAGYRGKSGGSGRAADTASLDKMLEGWAELLQQAGASLLQDQSDSLPG